MVTLVTLAQILKINSNTYSVNFKFNNLKNAEKFSKILPEIFKRYYKNIQPYFQKRFQKFTKNPKKFKTYAMNCLKKCKIFSKNMLKNFQKFLQKFSCKFSKKF